MCVLSFVHYRSEASIEYEKHYYNGYSYHRHFDCPKGETCIVKRVSIRDGDSAMGGPDVSGVGIGRCARVDADGKIVKPPPHWIPAPAKTSDPRAMELSLGPDCSTPPLRLLKSIRPNKSKGFYCTTTGTVGKRLP
ncbi:unnamed protein product [Vitrella brassicaformis CCMP3155]|uniref:Uncharacterized protein n=1 Tax=Vitrella brassicaformis (strain CCMP3155) TaxID=1169540 RepID=A0A0G4GB47_VITBC|nr:unnamed protein product [Vitrella brassicaformis CCMP3155]|eukprot:CEM26354.1 unnamed protein product [Vitrella brassicaformis CCMP3155]